MKQVYPDYRAEKIEQTSVYEALSSKNRGLVDAFLDYCRITAGEHSILKIQSKIIQVADIMEKDLDKTTLEDLREFAKILNESGRAIATKNDTKKVLKRFLKWKFDDWSKRFKELRDLKVSSKNEQRDLSKGDLLSPDEMQMIVSSVDSLKYKCILLLMQETANRPEEILKITWKSVDLESKEIKLHSSKTDSTRTIPINKSADHLKRYKEECFYPFAKPEDFVFPSDKNKDIYITPQSLHGYLQKLQVKLKFSKHLYPYLWRHSILTTAIKKLSPKVYEMFAGHSLEMGMKTYAHLDNEDLRQELNEKMYHLEELTKDEKKELEELRGVVGNMGKEIKQIKDVLKFVKVKK